MLLYFYVMFPTEEQKRFQIFKNNMKMARQIELYDLGTAKYGASPFADLTGLCFHVYFYGFWHGYVVCWNIETV